MQPSGSTRCLPPIGSDQGEPVRWHRICTPANEPAGLHEPPAWSAAGARPTERESAVPRERRDPPRCARHRGLRGAVARHAERGAILARYAHRWHTRRVRPTHQRGARVVLRSKDPEGVYQEAYGYLATHYAIRRLMHDAALRADSTRIDCRSRAASAPPAAAPLPPGISPRCLAATHEQASARSSPSHRKRGGCAPTRASSNARCPIGTSSAPSTATNPTHQAARRHDHHPGGIAIKFYKPGGRSRTRTWDLFLIREAL